jgi:hypothetical protein
MRKLFNDGYNSLWHFLFGILAYHYWIVIVIFVSYQLMDPTEENVLIDLTEFFIGYSSMYVYERITSL